MIYGYARVSTKGQSLDAQLTALRKYGCNKIFAEKISGDYKKRKNNREQWKALSSLLKSGDTVVVCKLDRLSRTLFEILSILDDFSKNGINFVSISDNFDTTTPYGKAMLHISAVFAQLELDLIRERTLEGLEEARRQGHYGGRKRIDRETQKKMYNMYYCGNYSISQIKKECSISSPTLYSYLNKYKENPELYLDIINNDIDLKDLPKVQEEKKPPKSTGRKPISQDILNSMKNLYYYTNYSQNEIADILGISKSSVSKYCLIFEQEHPKEKMKEVNNNEEITSV